MSNQNEQNRAEITIESIRAAGGLVHSDGNVFFRNVEQANAAISCAMGESEVAAIEKWKDHQVAQLVNELRSCAMQFHDQGQLRERIAHIVRPLFERGPAKAPERDISDYELLEAAMKGLEVSGKSARSVALALLKPDAIRKIVKAVNEAAR